MPFGLRTEKPIASSTRSAFSIELAARHRLELDAAAGVRPSPPCGACSFVTRPSPSPVNFSVAIE